MEAGMEKATFAAGCFWGVEEAFYDEPGVIATRVGYTGGTLENPTYQQVCSGTTGHAEAVEVTFEPARISYEQLLKIFWQSHDPTQLDRQGPDVGSQYRSAIFYHTDEQRVLAEASREALDLSGRYQRSVVTEVAPAATFWQAEEYHQKYHKKNGGGCGF
nr:peptide-methionine (S)-S-oxide reductase MsrA [Trichlorobacter thiogenes]